VEPAPKLPYPLFAPRARRRGRLPVFFAAAAAAELALTLVFLRRPAPPPTELPAIPVRVGGPVSLASPGPRQERPRGRTPRPTRPPVRKDPAALPALRPPPADAPAPSPLDPVALAPPDEPADGSAGTASAPGTAAGPGPGDGTGPGEGDGAPPRNVPAFAIQRDLIRQTPPRLSDVFRQRHRGGERLAGVYRVCVGRDGKVTQVIPVQGIAGADTDIADGIREGWLYKPQPVPVCFLYNVNVVLR
jgi:protein TonB